MIQSLQSRVTHLQTPRNDICAVIETTYSFSVNCCLLHESDRIDLVRKKILGCLAWGGLDQITEDEAGKRMFRRVSICCLEMVVALAVEIGEERGRNIKNMDQM